MGNGGILPKQFIEVEGVPILVHTLRRFQESSGVDMIYVVLPQAWVEHGLNLVTQYQIDKVVRIVPGGRTALESIFNGLTQIMEDGVAEDSLVMIHDGVRPIINHQLIETSVTTAMNQGNAISCIPAFETVALKRESGDLVETVVDRHRAYVLQAPQTFRLGAVYNINVRAQLDGKMGDFVDQANMQAHYGQELHLVEGLRGNVKITIPDDVRYFTYLVRSGEYQNIVAVPTIMKQAA